MDYVIKRTDKFNDQLIDIIMYLKNAFSTDEAKDYLDYIENRIGELKRFPYLGVVPRYQAIAKQGYRALVCKQNIIFYKVNETERSIILHIIVSAKMNYLSLI